MAPGEYLDKLLADSLFNKLTGGVFVRREDPNGHVDAYGFRVESDEVFRTRLKAETERIGAVELDRIRKEVERIMREDGDG